MIKLLPKEEVFDLFDRFIDDYPTDGEYWFLDACYDIIEEYCMPPVEDLLKQLGELHYAFESSNNGYWEVYDAYHHYYTAFIDDYIDFLKDVEDYYNATIDKRTDI
jgi:hypothetical protein